MTDPKRPPGFSFVQLRVLSARYELGEERPPESVGEITLGYKDSVAVDGMRVVVRQMVEARVVDAADKTKIVLRAAVELEGTFEGTADANFTAEDFGNNHVPGILFAFSREWIHKLTSSAGDWPPILLDPVNIQEMRKRQNPGAASRS